jgi:hypothetical protein
LGRIGRGGIVDMMTSVAGLILLISALKVPVSRVVPALDEPVTVRKFPPREQTLDEISEWIPKGIHGYDLVEDSIYTKDTVYDYLNGGAEIYLTYDFRGVLGRRYAHSDGSEIMFDMFDMGSPAEAFGIFSQEREGNPSDVGQGSDSTPGMLQFWKNRFYVSITATRVTSAAKNAVMKLGRATDGLIAGVGQKPEILDLLPDRGLAEDGVRYMHSFMALRHHYNLGWKDVLNMAGEVEAVLGEYSTAAGDSVLLVVEYPDDRAARRGADGYLGYMKEKPGVRITPTGTGEAEILSWRESRDEEEGEVGGQRWSSVQRAGPLLVIVLEAPEREEAERLNGEVLARWEKRRR